MKRAREWQTLFAFKPFLQQFHFFLLRVRFRHFSLFPIFFRHKISFVFRFSLPYIPFSCICNRFSFNHFYIRHKRIRKSKQATNRKKKNVHTSGNRHFIVAIRQCQCNDSNAQKLHTKYSFLLLLLLLRYLVHHCNKNQTFLRTSVDDVYIANHKMCVIRFNNQCRLCLRSYPHTNHFSIQLTHFSTNRKIQNRNKWRTLAKEKQSLWQYNRIVL